MQKIKQLYRKDYTGEDVNVTAEYVNQLWRYQTEHVANPFENLPLSNRAVVVGNGVTRLDFNLNLFLAARNTTDWGERSGWKPPINNAGRFNTYGCNALYRNYQPDFLITTGAEMIAELANSEYCDNNVVYANKQAVTNYPGKFHYVPQDPQWNSGAVATYIAAFDGHQKVFMIGFDGADSADSSYNVYAGTNAYPQAPDSLLEDYWELSMAEVFKAYPDTSFVRVAPTKSFRTPEAWKYCLNYRSIDFRQFVLEADL
jgi:hypothetical protein